MKKNKNKTKKTSKSPALKRGATVESSLWDLKLNFASIFSFKNRLQLTAHSSLFLTLISTLFIISSCSLFEEDKGNYQLER